MSDDNSAAKEPTAEPTQKPSEEMKYPNRQLELIRLSPMSRAAGISDHKFISSFRASPYHFNTKLTTQQEKVLSPSRHELLAHLMAQAPDFCLPSVLLNSKDRIRSLEEVAGKAVEAVDEDTIKLEFKNTVTSEDVIDHEKTGEEDSDEEDRNQSEDDEEMAADYAAEYADQDMDSAEDDDDDGDDSV